MFEKSRKHKQQVNVVHISQVFVAVSQNINLFLLLINFLSDLDLTGATQPITIFYGLQKAKTLLISQSANSFIKNYAIIFILGSPGANRRYDAIFSGESLLQELNFRPKISHRPV